MILIHVMYASIHYYCCRCRYRYIVIVAVVIVVIVVVVVVVAIVIIKAILTAYPYFRWFSFSTNSKLASIWYIITLDYFLIDTVIHYSIIVLLAYFSAIQFRFKGEANVLNGVSTSGFAAIHLSDTYVKSKSTQGHLKVNVSSVLFSPMTFPLISI